MDASTFLETARQFREQTVRPHADEWETSRLQPVDALRAAAAEGLMRLETPASHGGYGLDYLTKLQFCEEMSEADMPFVFSLINTQNVAARLSEVPALADLYVDDILTAKRFAATALSEPGAGSDFAGIKTLARQVDGGWELTGSKGWITNAQIADIFVTYAQTDPSLGWKGVACFLVDGTQAGFKRGTSYELMGGHAIGAGEFHLDGYHVPETHVLAGPGDGFKLAMAGVNGARVYVAAMCAGLIADALQKAVTYGGTREAFGVPLLSHQGLRWKLADVATELEAMRALTRKAGDLIATGGDAVMAAAQAKKFATERTILLLETCIQAMGANGLRAEHGLGRHLAAAKIAGYTDGSIEMMNERVGAGLAKTYGAA